MGQSFQDEFSDVLLLKMLRSATEASKDKDKASIFRFVPVCTMEAQLELDSLAGKVCLTYKWENAKINTKEFSQNK